MATASQRTRQIAIATPLGEDAVLLQSLSGQEGLSQIFEYEVELYSEAEEFDPQKIVGRNVTLSIHHDDKETRYINGIVREFQQGEWGDQFTTYHAKIVPWLWQLSLSTDVRIFQNLSVPEILQQVFESLGFDDFELNLSGDYQLREYCVQYRESDLDFVSRLMEEEGIFYFFQHENGKHTLVLGDSTSVYFDLPDAEVELAAPGHTAGILDQLKSWQHSVQFRSGAVAKVDYDFKKPKTRLNSTEKSIINLGSNQNLEVYDYPGLYEESATGDGRVRVRMEAIEATHDIASGKSTYHSFTPGGTFTVDNHRTESEIGKQYVLLTVKTKASVGGSYVTGSDVAGSSDSNAAGSFEFENSFTCIPASTVFRPEQTTPQSIVEGPQTAIVVGPPGEEIYTDQHGRVKCQFYWDRIGKRDENSSCWIRVSQIHAGKGWGSISIPRIGEEVLVSFLEGNPDRPIIKGRVYNAEKMPPFALPAGKTRSGLKSDTHKGSGYNEMSADDTAGKEQIRTNAQFDMDTTVGNNQTLAVAVDRTEDIGNNDTLTVAVDKSSEIGNDQTTTVGNNETVTVGNNIVIDAGTSITLATGASTIHMNQAGVITISGQYITSAAAVTNSTIAPLTEVVGSTMLLQAGAACFDLGGVCHVKGKEVSVGGANVNVKAEGVVVVKGAPIMIGEVGAPTVTLSSPGSSSSDPPGGLSEATAKKMSEDAYHPKKMQKLKDKNELYKTKDGKEWEVLEVRDDSDGFKAVVLKDQESGQVVVAFGGTDSLNDWDDNVSQTVGGIPSQYQSADELVEKFGQDGGNIAVTGHSLGGGLANYAGGKNGVPGVGFNSAPLGPGTRAAIANSPNGNTDDFVHYNNQQDIVSKTPGQQMGTIVTHYNDKGYLPGDSHSIETVDTKDPISAQGPLADQVYQNHWQNRLSDDLANKPGSKA